MNILDSEEMLEVERQMLALEPLPPYILNNPAQYPPTRHTSTLAPTFIHGELSADHPLRRMLPNTRSTLYLREEDPNSPVKLFAYAFLALLFPSGSLTPNHSLLETLKCSLYSRDVNFYSAPRSRPVDSLQAKAMLTRFLNTLTTSPLSNVERVYQGQVMLESNHMLVELFVLFFRAILAKLDLEGAQDYTYPLLFEETLLNLLEFFDIHHRHLPSLFLLPEENYFLAAAGPLYFGEYFENQTSKIKQESIQSTESSPIHQPLSQEKQINPQSKKHGVFHNDIKLFNFLLESGRSSLGNAVQKSKQIQTPHFPEAQQFAFGRRRDLGQLQRQEELKREFQRLIMNCDGDSIPEEPVGKVEENSSPETPVIGGQFAFKMAQQAASNFQRETSEGSKPKAFLRKSTFNQSPLVEQDPVESPKLNPEHRNGKNIVSVKDKNFTNFSPQPNIASKFESFTNFANDANFLDADGNADYFKSSSGKIADLTLPYLNGECRCLEAKRMRNKIHSRIVQFIYSPNKNTRSPKFLHNLKYSQNINLNSPKIKVTPPKEREYELANVKEQRIPTFLKSLKRDKDKDKYSASSKSKSKPSVKDHSLTPSPGKQCKQKPDLDQETINRVNSKFAKFSAILSKSPLQAKAKESKSTTRKNESSSLSKRVVTELGGTIKRFDARFINARPGLGNNWKSSSNFHHPYPNLQKKPIKQEQLGKRQTMRAFPSPHASPLYLKGSNARVRQPEIPLERRQTKQSQIVARVPSSKLAQAHSSQKYKEFTQLVSNEGAVSQ